MQLYNFEKGAMEDHGIDHIENMSIERLVDFLPRYEEKTLARLLYFSSDISNISILKHIFERKIQSV